MHFICVGTPQKADENAADLSYVRSAVDDILPLLKPGDVVVGKSTVPVGTAEAIAERIEEREPGAELVWNPEFLREGHAVEDTLQPGPAGLRLRARRGRRRGPRACSTRCTPRRWPTGTPKIETDLATAQLVKVAANSFLATKISFINAMAELCEATGADVTMLADAIGHDDRIGRRFLNAGVGFGGGCLPKDIRAFMARAGELGVDQALSFLREVDSINMRRRVRMVDLAREVCGGSIVGRRIAVLGRGVQAAQRRHPRLAGAQRGRADAAPGRPGDRHRPAGHRQRPQEVARALLRRHRRGRRPGRGGRCCCSPSGRSTSPSTRSRSRSRSPSPRIIDGRNCLDPVTWRAAGWTYRALGRP